MTAESRPSSAADQARDGGFLHNDLIREYFELVNLVTSFDQRLVTIKGWGVTLSLASLGLGFQQDHYGLFLVAAVSGVAFWVVEGQTKWHQMRYYPRMGDIEVAMFDLFGQKAPRGDVSSPLMNWGWNTAGYRLRGGRRPEYQDRQRPDRPVRWDWEPNARHSFAFRYPLLLPHVMLPHVVSVVVGGALFVVGLLGYLGPI